MAVTGAEIRSILDSVTRFKTEWFVRPFCLNVAGTPAALMVNKNAVGSEA